MKTLGYAFFGHDNGSYAFLDDPGIRRCKCGLYFEKWDHIPTTLHLRKRTLDVSATYDGAEIVSQRFHSLYLQESWTGLEFRPLLKEPGFFQIVSKTVIKFDAEKRKTRFLDRCDVCGRFRAVAGVTPVFLRDGETIPAKAFGRSDIEFGTGPEMAPLMMCGVEVASKLRTQKMKGLDLIAIASN
jgi:hypothetical protein